MHLRTVKYTISCTLLFVFFIVAEKTYAQEKFSENVSLMQKSFNAERISIQPKIDGFLDDDVWKNIKGVSDFIMYSPFNGIKPLFNTEVKVAYDDNALYIAAMMYDPHPDSIFKELGKRDASNLNADYFSVQISSFNDGIYGETFKVSSSNVQTDSKEKVSSESNQFSGNNGGEWDAVWESKTRIIDKGWSCEMRIPFSALRFSTKKDQVWGINFWREVRRIREVSSWNYVDKSTGSTINHLGQMAGISDVEPPLRLSLMPYLSGYIEKNSHEKKFGTSYNGGMDLKIGLNESYTLDATLIPDFGQVQSDDHILNLTPYETKYNENRSFFTEGTELFSRGNIFYSRRIGGVPHLMGNLSQLKKENEIITDNPAEVTLINATKVSGRSQNGLGIGVFNALTNPMRATLKDTVTNISRGVITEPLTNYNMIVLDQSLKNNSYVSLANTNVWRAATKDANFYTANVSSIQSRIQNKSKHYSLTETASLSQKYYSDHTNFGNFYDVVIGKTGGSFRASYELKSISEDFDPNDMGYLTRNNEIDQSGIISYNIFNPKGSVMSAKSSIGYGNSRLFMPSAFISEVLAVDQFLVFMNYWSLSFEANYTPRGENDYFEPRTSDFSKYYHRPKELELELSFDTDMSKKFYIMAAAGYSRKWDDFHGADFSVTASPIVKISDRLSFSGGFTYSSGKNDIGYVDTNSDGIIFGKRGVNTFENTISGAYIFSAESSLSIRLRHYWSRADYANINAFYLLNDDGSLRNNLYQGSPDRNINFMNIDMTYLWRFAPGSEISVVWKNSIAGYSDEIENNAFRNFDNMLGLANTNSISLKILYYLDYQNLKRMSIFK